MFAMKATGELVTDFSRPVIILSSGFTPNGDGKNDSFGRLAGRISSYQFSIYNRWANGSLSPTHLKNGMVCQKVLKLITIRLPGMPNLPCPANQRNHEKEWLH